ncbi:hypothetical protein [Coleofasciculus sp. G2-EDA-02]|uniref:hypothetical protein n=1 Tax=Coleofasciculus sp. G2-EDA-02 TaxID=3069529 RepID=UPI0032FE8F9C
MCALLLHPSAPDFTAKSLYADGKSMTRGASLQPGRTSVRPYGICDSVILINGMRSRFVLSSVC